MVNLIYLEVEQSRLRHHFVVDNRDMVVVGTVVDIPLVDLMNEELNTLINKIEIKFKDK